MRIIILLISVLSLFSCNKQQDKEFQLIYQQFQNEMNSTPLLKAFLEQRLYSDSIAIVANPEMVTHTLLFAQKNMNQLHNIQIDHLDESLHEHYQNLHSFLNIILENIETKKVHQTHPSFYSPKQFLEALNTKQNLQEIRSGLKSVNNNFQTAILSMQNVPKDSLIHSIQLSVDCFQFLSNTLQPQIKSIKEPKEDRKAALYELTKAKLMLKDYIGFCNSLIFETGNAFEIVQKTH